jgi:outer membrane immunogenic protein
MVNTVPNWAGLYVGGSVGFGTGRTSDSYTDASSLVESDRFYAIINQTASDSFDMSGTVFGAHLGYNFQRGPVVFGLEAAYNSSQIEGDKTYVGIYGYPDGEHDIAGVETYSIKRKLGSYYTAVGRLGYTNGSALFYGFGGAAWGKVKTTGTYTDAYTLDGNPDPYGPVTISASADHFGWTAGAGIEYMLSDRLSARVEYAHVDLGDKNIFSGVSNIPGAEKVDLSFDTIKIGASYKLIGDREELK